MQNIHSNERLGGKKMKKLIILIMFLFSFLNANANWELIYEDLITFSIYDNTIYVGTENGLFISSDNGDNWELDSYFDGIWITLIKFYEDVLYINGYKKLETSEYQEYFYISSDFGNTWLAKKTNLYITDFIVVKGEIFVPSSEVIKSTDMGDTWEAVGPKRVSTLAYHNGIIYAGTDADPITSNQMYISTDMGLTWEYKNEGLRGNQIGEFSHTFLFSKGDSIFLGGGYFTLLATTNNDDGWWKVSEINSYYFKIWKEILFSSASFLGGLHISSDYGITRNTTIFDTTITWLFDKGQAKIIEINEHTNSIFALEHVSSSYIPNRLYRASLDHIVSVEDNIKQPQKLSIHPNPAGDYIIVENADTHSDIEIYSVLGIIQMRTAYTNRIDVSRLPAGVYFLRSGVEYTVFVKN